MKKILSIILILLIVSCNENSDSQIGKKLNEICINQNCEIDMSTIVPEDWDYMYIFKTNASLEFINSKLGFNYLYFEDIANRVIFVKDGKVVYHEDEFPNPEKIKKGEIIFETDNKEFIKVAKKESIFIVHSESGYFKLNLKK